MNLNPAELIYPVFVKEGITVKESIDSLPGQYRHCIDDVDVVADELIQAGLDKVLVFGIPQERDGQASCAKNPDGVVQDAIKIFKKKKLKVIADVCLCHYTDHGECRIIDEGGINEKLSLNALAEIAHSYARAGADYVAPSASLNGQVKAIHTTLDDHGFSETKIMSYSAKFASAFYGPYRDAVESPYGGGLRSYQLPPGDREGALERIEAEVGDGADAVIVKPALPYLDVILEAKSRVDVPVVAYQVSGEYSALKSLNSPHALIESLVSIKRAGADYIITYAAAEAFRGNG